MRTRFVLAVLSVVTIVATAAPASAAQIIDPNDAAGPLDLRLLRVDQPANGNLHVRIETYGPWAKSIIAKSNPNRWFAYFDTEPGSGPEYRGRILYTNGDLIIHIKGQGSDFENLPVQKPNKKTLTFTVPRDAPMNPEGVGIATRTVYVAHDNTYFDRAPDGGFLSDV